MTHAGFRLPANLEHRSLAVDIVATLISHVTAADRAFRHAMITAFGEAFNNIVIHGYRDQTEGMIEVEADLDDEEMTLRLIDTGHSVDFSGVALPDFDSLPERGMGVFMIHALVDRVAYEGGTPNVLSLTKRTTPTLREPDAA